MNKKLLVVGLVLFTGCGIGKKKSGTQQTAARIALDGSNATGATPLTVMLDATTSTCSEWCADYEWNFADGSAPSHQPWVSHVFNQDGKYAVTLTVTDGSGEVSTATMEIGAGVTGSPPGPR